MKVRASPTKGRRLTVDLQRDEAALPAFSTPDLQLKRILVPTDFSASSRKALSYAVSLAKQFGAEILLLHVVEPVIPPPSAALLLPESLELDIRKEAAARLTRWRNETGLTSGHTAVRSGSPYHEIIHAADETNTDLIIMGTRGHTKLARLVLGSTAERVVRHAGCPVLVVREREHDFVQATKPALAKARSRDKM